MNQRLIAYVSRAIERDSTRLPTELPKISLDARKNNSTFKVTGVLSYSSGYYLQVIEGEDSLIEHLFSNISIDTRHKNVRKILDVKTTEQYFPGWSMRLVSSLNKEPLFRQLMRSQRSDFNFLSQETRDILSIFYVSGGDGSHQIDPFDDKSIKLSSWPDFTKVQPTPPVIELSAKLVNQRTNYSDLVRSGDFGTKQQIDELLKKFELMNIVVISDARTAETKVEKPTSPSRFYRKMKQFLSIS